jgi:hypothetical protein
MAKLQEVPVESPQLQVVEKDDDPRYYKLTKPIHVGDRQLDRLLLDPSELNGTDFFQIIAEFKRKFPEDARAFSVKVQNENFLSLVLSRCNNIAPEDLAKCTFQDLNAIFLRSMAFQFSGAAVTTAGN